jgi:hypothetical protein
MAGWSVLPLRLDGLTPEAGSFYNLHRMIYAKASRVGQKDDFRRGEGGRGAWGAGNKYVTS